jgi:hypothetical protein
MNTLIVDDNDLNCNCEGLTLEEINLGKVGFVNVDLEKFHLIVYKGKRGKKILKGI